MEKFWLITLSSVTKAGLDLPVMKDLVYSNAPTTENVLMESALVKLAGLENSVI